MFSCEFCKRFRNVIFHNTYRWLLLAILLIWIAAINFPWIPREITRFLGRNHKESFFNGMYYLYMFLWIVCIYLYGIYVCFGICYTVQVPRWPSNFVPGIKTKFKEFSGERWKKPTGVSWSFTRELSQNFQNIYLDHFCYQLCLKNTKIPWNVLLLCLHVKSCDGISRVWNLWR